MLSYVAGGLALAVVSPPVVLVVAGALGVVAAGAMGLALARPVAPPAVVIR
jgi:hypothetical protein